MCGVPYHACDLYISRLIKKGYKVAICEQVENPADAKGVVKREALDQFPSILGIEPFIVTKISNAPQFFL